VRAYVDDPSAQTLSVGANIAAIRFAFSCLKGLVVESRARPGAGAAAGGDDVAKLQLQLQQVMQTHSLSIFLTPLHMIYSPSFYYSFLSHSPHPPFPAAKHRDRHPRQHAEQTRQLWRRRSHYPCVLILSQCLFVTLCAGAAAEAAAAHCPPMRAQVTAAVRRDLSELCFCDILPRHRLLRCRRLQELEEEVLSCSTRSY
jgi:hypothetical protein